MNLKDTLESLIAQTMADEQELIPTHELPAAKVIAQRIEALEKALQELICTIDLSKQEGFNAVVKAEKVLAQS